MHKFELGFDPTHGIAVVEYRPPDLNAHNPRVKAQDLAEDTRQGRILQHINAKSEETGVAAVLVDAANTDNGQVREWFTLDASRPYGLARHESPAGTSLGLSAWRLRNLNLDDGDPEAFVDGRGFNALPIRKRLTTRPEVMDVLSELGLTDAERIPSIRVENGEIVALPEGRKVFVKPFDVSDVIERAPRYRAQLVANNVDDVRRAVQAAGGNAILQPLLPVMPARALLESMGASLPTGDMPPDLLHTVRFYDFLWKDDLPAVAEVRLTDPRPQLEIGSQASNIGALYATHSELLEAGQVYETYPGVAALHNEVRQGLRRIFGPLGSLAMNYLVLPDASARIVSVDARAFTPDLSDEDSQRQALSRSLAVAEAEQLIVLGRLKANQVPAQPTT